MTRCRVYLQGEKVLPAKNDTIFDILLGPNDSFLPVFTVFYNQIALKCSFLKDYKALSLGRKSDTGEKTTRFFTSLGFKDFIYTCFTEFYSQISLNICF